MFAFPGPGRVVKLARYGSKSMAGYGSLRHNAFHEKHHMGYAVS